MSGWPASLSVPVIRTDRLDLVVFPPELMTALIAGDKVGARRMAAFVTLPDDLFPPTAVDRDFFRMRLAQVLRDPSWAPWSLRAIVLREQHLVIGTANFHGPPGVNDTSTPGAAEFGYEIFPPHRNAGYATEVARALLAWAHDEHGVTHFISGVAPDNAPSLWINDKIGFVRTGQIVDGEVIFELRR
jgi:[ribosomal protein S5]-alanine N-acetyltransferase